MELGATEIRNKASEIRNTGKALEQKRHMEADWLLARDELLVGIQKHGVSNPRIFKTDPRFF